MPKKIRVLGTKGGHNLIDINKANFLLGDTEVLDNIARYIKENVGRQDWTVHIACVSSYLAVGIRWTPDEVKGYLNTKLKVG